MNNTLAVGHFIHFFSVIRTTVNRSLDSLSTVKLLHTQLTTTEGRGAEFGQQKFAMAARRARCALCRTLGIGVLVSWCHGRENDFSL